jgi:hypothetical protein
MFSLLAAVITLVTLNGAPVSGALNQNGHIIVPLRAPMEAVGGKVDWSDATQTGVASSPAGEQLISATVGNQTVLVTGNPVQVDLAPQLVNGLEYIPVEMLAEISNADVVYSPDRSSAAITGFDLEGMRAKSNNLKGVLPIWVGILVGGGIAAAIAIAAGAPRKRTA